MANLRVLWRSIALLSLIFAAWLLLVAGHLGLRRQLVTRRRLERAIFRRWARAVCWVLGVRVTVEGVVPGPPCLLVSNHLSYVDVPVIASVFPSRFVAKAEVRSWPIVGWSCRLAEMLFVDRTSRPDARRVADEIRVAIESGDNVVVFPEGTSTAGHRVAPFRSPLLASAAAAGVPVHFSAIGYSVPGAGRPAHLAVCWWGGMAFGSHVLGLLKLPRVDARLSFGREPLGGHDRKALAIDLQRAVSELFRPVVDFAPEDPS